MQIFYDRLTNRVTKSWDQLRGLDFESGVTAEQAGLNPTQSHNSTPSGNRFLKRVLDSCLITRDDSILDLGCGKGSAMRLMRRYPFHRIVGVEMSEVVASIAARNFALIGDDRCTVKCMNATHFTDFTSFRYLYMYNPFPCPIMQQVMDNVSMLLPQHHAFTIIYCNPVCHDVVIRSATFIQYRDFQADWGNRMYVYQRTPDVPQPL